jgi:hypothetical protein
MSDEEQDGPQIGGWDMLVAAMQNVAQNGPQNHDYCTLEQCEHRRIAVIRANTNDLEHLQKDFAAIHRKLDEALVDLAPVQTMKLAMDAMVNEIDLLRAAVRRLQGSPARESLAWQMAD